MAAKNGFVQGYASSEIDERVEIIFKNFENFIDLVDMFEDNICDQITEEKRFNRRAEIGECGVRVQTSRKSDPTFSQASNHFDSIVDIRRGNLDKLLEYTDDAEGHRDEIETLELMRRDYTTVTSAMSVLSPKDRTELKDVLNKEKAIVDIIESTGNLYESVKSRLYRNRRKVKIQAKELIEMRMGKAA